MPFIDEAAEQAFREARWLYVRFLMAGPSAEQVAQQETYLTQILGPALLLTADSVLLFGLGTDFPGEVDASERLESILVREKRAVGVKLDVDFIKGYEHFWLDRRRINGKLGAYAPTFPSYDHCIVEHRSIESYPTQWVCNAEVVGVLGQPVKGMSAATRNAIDAGVRRGSVMSVLKLADSSTSVSLTCSEANVRRLWERLREPVVSVLSK